jgi:hypothetical protein
MFLVQAPVLLTYAGVFCTGSSLFLGHLGKIVIQDKKKNITGFLFDPGRYFLSGGSINFEKGGPLQQKIHIFWVSNLELY